MVSTEASAKKNEIKIYHLKHKTENLTENNTTNIYNLLIIIYF